MAERPTLQDLTRQVLIQGTSCVTDATGHDGYKTEVVVAGALLRIAETLELQTDSLLATKTGFTREQQSDGQNHFKAYHMKGSRVVEIEILATSYEMGQQFVQNIAAVIQAAIAKVDQPRESWPLVSTHSPFAVLYIPAERAEAFRSMFATSSEVILCQEKPAWESGAQFGEQEEATLVQFTVQGHNAADIFFLGSRWGSLKERLGFGESQEGGAADG
jgi:hypothetical protein